MLTTTPDHPGEGRGPVGGALRLQTDPESDPVLKAIIDVRHKAAATFTPAFSGQRFEDFDRGLLAAFEAARAAMIATLPDGDGRGS